MCTCVCVCVCVHICCCVVDGLGGISLVGSLSMQNAHNSISDLNLLL